jgi:hypothetical protein
MNLTIPSPVGEKHEAIKRWRLKSLIDWRHTQIKMLHTLRGHLIDLKGNMQGDDLCDITAVASAFIVTDSNSAEIDERDESQPQWSVTLWDGTQSAADVSFLSEEQQSLLAQILRLSKDAAGKDDAAGMLQSPLTISAKKIDAIKLGIRNRIDEFNQLNRDDLESLRILNLG